MESGIIEVEWLKEPREAETEYGKNMAESEAELEKETAERGAESEGQAGLPEETGFTQVREGGRTYLRCVCESFGGDEEAMLADNQMEGLLNVAKKCINGRTQLSYDITGKQSLSGCYEKKAIAYSELCAMLLSVHDCLNRMEEYLLSEGSLVFSPAYLYKNLTGGQLYFVYLPAQRDGFAEHIREFASFLMEHVEYEDERAAALAGQFYQYTEAENFSLTVFLEENRAYFEGTEVQKEEGEQTDDRSGQEWRMQEENRDGNEAAWQQEMQDSGKRPVLIGLIVAAIVVFIAWSLPWNAQTLIPAGILAGAAAGMGVWYPGWAKRTLEKKEREIFFMDRQSPSGDAPSAD
ncbi:MAG: DUF6382 domain-containing protein [Clostridium sp.]|nr:DUF6382 domain-containing protein [Clostridium sp.]